MISKGKGYAIGIVSDCHICDVVMVIILDVNDRKSVIAFWLSIFYRIFVQLVCEKEDVRGCIE